jgi:hypothetical protein
MKKMGVSESKIYDDINSAYDLIARNKLDEASQLLESVTQLIYSYRANVLDIHLDDLLRLSHHDFLEKFKANIDLSRVLCAKGIIAMLTGDWGNADVMFADALSVRPDSSHVITDDGVHHYDSEFYPEIYYYAMLYYFWRNTIGKATEIVNTAMQIDMSLANEHDRLYASIPHSFADGFGETVADFLQHSEDRFLADPSHAVQQYPRLHRRQINLYTKVKI